MDHPLHDDQAARSLLSRREVLGGGVLLGLGAVLTGCQNKMSVPSPMAGANTTPVTPYIPGPLPTPSQAPPAGTAQAAGVPTGVIPRSAWTRTGPIAGRTIYAMGGVSRITIHHEGDSIFTSTDQGTVAGRLESIRQYHTTRTKLGRPGEKWADIGYHYIIDPAGRVWEGRSARYQGAHVQDENEHNLGVMVMGNFDKQSPTPQALGALDLFVAQQMRMYRVPRSRVFTHRELNPTECPGSRLQGYMVKTRGRGGRLAMAAEELGLA